MVSVFIIGAVQASSIFQLAQECRTTGVHSCNAKRKTSSWLAWVRRHKFAAALAPAFLVTNLQKKLGRRQILLLSPVITAPRCSALHAR